MATKYYIKPFIWRMIVILHDKRALDGFEFAVICADHTSLAGYIENETG